MTEEEIPETFKDQNTRFQSDDRDIITSVKPLPVTLEEEHSKHVQLNIQQEYHGNVEHDHVQRNKSSGCWDIMLKKVVTSTAQRETHLFTKPEPERGHNEEMKTSIEKARNGKFSTMFKKRLIIWLIVCEIASVYCIIGGPFMESFFQNRRNHVLDILFDCILIIDATLKLILTIDSELASKSSSIFIFLMNIVACFPYYLFSSLSGLVFIKAFLRYIIFRSRKDSVRKNVAGNPLLSFKHVPKLVRRLFSQLILIFVVAHFAACGWHFLGLIPDSQFGSWIDRWDVSNQSVGFMYLSSLYWSYTTLVTCGYGDISPRGSLEISWAMSFQLIGAILFSYTTASIATLITEEDEEERIYKERILKLQAFCKKIKLSKSSIQVVLDLGRKFWKVPRHVINAKWSSIVPDLPQNLRIDILSHLFPDLYMKIEILNSLNAVPSAFKFLKDFVSLLEPVQFTKGEFLFKANSEFDRIFIVWEGELSALNKKGKKIQINRDGWNEPLKFKAGNIVGLIGILGFEECLHSVRCDTRAQCLVMEKDLLHNLMEDLDADTLDVIFSYANEEHQYFQEYTNAINARSSYSEIGLPSRANSQLSFDGVNSLYGNIERSPSAGSISEMEIPMATDASYPFLDEQQIRRFQNFEETFLKLEERLQSMDDLVNKIVKKHATCDRN